MANPSKLEKLARERGITVYELVNAAVIERKSARGAADALGVPLMSIQWWMARNGLRIETSANLAKTSRPELEAVNE